MKRVFAIAAVFGLVALAQAHVFAGSVGKIDNKIQVENVNQKVSGLLNKNELTVGTVKGNAGYVKQDIQVKNVNQKASGLLNKNQIEIGGTK